ncbi:peptidylprolyl isomerase [Peptococcaceae bacterium]|nr:peptidylprolyl isomerase [Peptococcaceae bacterium]
MAYNGSDGEQSDKEQTAVGKNNGENIVLGELGDVKKATIKTSKGDIVVELYPDAMPITVANFEKLVSVLYLKERC